MEYGNGRIISCSLDLEDHYLSDAAAAHCANNLIAYAASAPITPKVKKVVYIGGDGQARMLDNLHALYERVDRVPDAGVLLLGTGYTCPESEIIRFAEHGGTVIVLPQEGASGILGSQLRYESNFGGSLNPPKWPLTRGLSMSDLRWRSRPPGCLRA